MICTFAAILGAALSIVLNLAARKMVHKEPKIKSRNRSDIVKQIIYAVLSAAAFAAIAFRYGISWTLLQYLLLTCILMICSFTDIEALTISDIFIIIGAAIGVAFIFIRGSITQSIIDAALGGLAIPLVILLIVLIYEKIRKRNAIGGGDIKLLFVTGLSLGFEKNMLTLLFACIIGIIFAFTMPRKAAQKDESSNIQTRTGNPENSSKPFPWGPSIAIGAVLSMVFGDALISLLG